MTPRKLLIGSCLAALSALSTPAFADDARVTISDFVGTVTINTAPGAALAVTKTSNGGDLRVSESRGRLTLDGGIKKPDGDGCKGYYGKISWSWSDKKEKSGKFGGYKDLDTYPELIITAPDDITLVIDNAIIFGSAGDIGAANIKMSHCGNFTAGNIAGQANISLSGSGDLTAGDIGTLSAKVTGSGDLEFENTGDAEITMRGSGDARFENARNLTLKTSGSSDIEMDTITGNLTATSSGSSDIEAQRLTGDLVYTTRGSSDFTLDDISGDADITISGSGEVDIDDGEIGTLTVVSRGSGNFDFGGTAKDAHLTASGSSDIYVSRVTDLSHTKSSGSSDIDIGS